MNYNAAAAFSVAKLSGINDKNITEGILATPQVPGRFEVLSNGTRKVIIDYSHTPDSLEKTLMVIRKITDKKNPLYTVFGCGGNRDKLKRPVMGKIATELSDEVIVTSDNPRSYYLRAITVLNMPENFGGGAEAAKPIFKKAKMKFDSFQPESDI